MADSPRRPFHYAWVVAAVTFVVLLITAGVFSFLLVGQRTFRPRESFGLAAAST